VLVGITLAVVGVSTSEIPRKINYQGRLTDSATGQPLPGYHDLGFRIFDAASGGNALWAEVHAMTVDSSGVFSVILGNKTPMEIWFPGPVWMEVMVDDETLSPRREIVSVPFAFLALNADSLGGYGSEDFVLAGDMSSITGDMITDGQITDADIDPGAAIDPGKIAGTAWTSDNDGDGSGLDADMVDGLHADAFSDTGHIHDERYYTEEELSEDGTINLPGNPVDWTKLKGVPEGLADGVDDEGTGDGHSLDAVDGDPVDAVYVDGDGNVGVGTADPVEELDVTGDVSITSKYMIVGRPVLYVPGDHSVALGMDACGGRVVSEITALGDSAGYSCTAASNTFVGSGAGRSTTTGSGNVFVGAHAGYSNVNGIQNTFIGCDAGKANLSAGGNTFVGSEAGLKNGSGGHNTFLGNEAGHSNIGGGSNTHVGSGAGAANETGFGYVCIGAFAGADSKNGQGNTYIGSSAGHHNVDGIYNTIVGSAAGANGPAGSFNVFIGHMAGIQETGSNKLYIANGMYSEDCLIYGDFETGRIGLGTLDPERNLHIVGDNPRILIEAESVAPEINLKNTGDASTDIWSIYKHGTADDLRFYQDGDKVTLQNGTGNVGIGTTNPGSYKLYVSGDACGTGTWGACSDLKYKRDVKDIEGALDKVMSIRGVSFGWKTREYPDKGFDSDSHYGVIAQEIEDILPEVVREGVEGEKAVAYSELIPVLIESIKQLKDENERLSERLAAVEAELN
jgi:hypothetical protein